MLKTSIFVNYKEVKINKFPAGELNIKLPKLTFGDMYHIDAYVYDYEGVFALALVIDAIRQRKMVDPLYINLNIPFVPGARQDRVCNAGEAFSAKVTCSFINSFKLDRVCVRDPHSDVLPALLDNCKVVHQHELIPEDILDNKVIVCPDTGAEKKIGKLKRPYIMATKVRDVSTGNITATKVYAEDSDLKGKNCIIIDDICDGGRTFVELAKVLKEKGAETVDLYVTHGLFTKGLDALRPHIDTIYTYIKGDFTKLEKDTNYEI